jgi:hypothetical protein
MFTVGEWCHSTKPQKYRIFLVLSSIESAILVKSFLPKRKMRKKP